MSDKAGMARDGRLLQLSPHVQPSISLVRSAVLILAVDLSLVWTWTVWTGGTHCCRTWVWELAAVRE